MPGPEAKVSLLLTGGIDNRAESEFAQPVVTQGTILKLKESRNTRLSVRPGGLTRSPRFEVIPDSVYQPTNPNEPGYALVPSANGSRSILMRSNRWSVGGYLYGDAGRAEYGNTYLGFVSLFPGAQAATGVAHIVDAGSVGGAKSLGGIATTYHPETSTVWRAWLSNPTGFSTNVDIYVSAESGDGVAYCQPYRVVFSVRSTWVALTSHGVNGVRLWWIDDAATELRSALVSLSAGSRPTLSPAVSAITAPSAIYSVDVCSGGDVEAFLITGIGGSARIYRVNASTGAVSGNVTLSAALTGGGQVAISSMLLRGTRYLVACASSVTNDNTTLAALLQSSLANLWTPVTVDGYGRVACGFIDRSPANEAAQAVWALTVVPGSFTTNIASGSPEAETRIMVKELVTGAGLTTRVMSFRSIQSHMAQWSPIAGTTVALFLTAPIYGLTDQEFGDANYCDDPALTVHACVGPGDSAPIARFGCVRGGQAPARIQVDGMLSSKTLHVVDQTIHATYRQHSDTSELVSTYSPRGSPGRFVRFDMSPRQVSVAHDRDGAAHFAAALPMTWDGAEVFEMGGYQHTPRLIAAAGGGGASLPAGVYRLRAVQRWVDATGCLHRSRPSAIATVTLGAPGTIRAAATPASQRISRSHVETALYVSATNGKTEGLTAINSQDYATLSGQITRWEVPTPNAAGALVYTTEAEGAERAPQPPPPLWDIAIIGPRLWGLDAEVRSRFVYSKYRVAGIGYEFHPSFEVMLPSGSGKGMAARVWNGVPLLLAERGIYTVSGEGPLNTGLGGSYSTPSKVSDFGCSNTASVAVFPGGIIWQFGARFVVCSGAGIQLVPDFVCTHDVSCNVVLTQHSEVLFFSATVPEVRVYNYELNRWTIWDSETLSEPVHAAAIMPWDPDCAMVYSQGTGLMRRLEANTVSAATHMGIETDWILLGGDFQDHVIVQSLVFSAAAPGGHGLEIDIWTDYSVEPTTHRAWSNLEIQEMAGTERRYTVRVEPQIANCRSIKLRVRDVLDGISTNTQGFAPRALTLIYQLNGKVYEEAFEPIHVASK